MASINKRAAKQEPVFLVKPISRYGGLDNLHISLIALAALLAILAFVLANFHSTVVCAAGELNGTCVTPSHTSAQAISAAGKIIAAYSSFNSSLSLLPYYSLINESKASYLANRDEWLVTVPYVDPFTNEQVNLTLIIRDSNLTLAQSSMQTVAPSSYSNKSVVALGTIGLPGRSDCSYSAPVPVYMFTDPYAPHALADISSAINFSAAHASQVNTSYKFIFSNYAISKYTQYGVNATQLLGGYLACASAQPRFAQFVGNLSTVYDGSPLSGSLLYQIANASGLSMGEFSSCMNNVSDALVHQAQLAYIYNVTVNPSFVVNCRYSTIPSQLGHAVGYAINQLNASSKP